ncbi:hypothetical protein [Gimesia sp.]
MAAPCLPSMVNFVELAAMVSFLLFEDSIFSTSQTMVLSGRRCMLP